MYRYFSHRVRHLCGRARIFDLNMALWYSSMLRLWMRTKPGDSMGVALSAFDEHWSATADLYQYGEHGRYNGCAIACSRMVRGGPDEQLCSGQQ